MNTTDDKNAIYSKACELFMRKDYSEALALFEQLDGWLDSKEKVQACNEGIVKLHHENELLQKQASNKQTHKKRIKIIAIIMSFVGVFAIIAILSVVLFFIPLSKYNSAIKLLENKQYDEGYEILYELGSFKHSDSLVLDNKYERAISLLEKKDYTKGYQLLEELGEYKDSANVILDSKYERALTLLDAGEYEDAYSLLNELQSYKNASDEIKKSIYSRAKTAYEDNKLEEAYELLETIIGFSEQSDEMRQSIYVKLINNQLKKYDSKDITSAISFLRSKQNDPDFNQELQNQYNDYISEYRSTIINEAKSKFEHRDYQAALDVLKKALSVLPNDTDIKNKITEYEDSIPTVPSELKQYENGLIPEDKTYRVELDEDDWYINYRSSPVYISLDKTNNNIIGKLRHGTEIYVEYIYDKTWAVFIRDNEYVFASIYSLNDPSEDRLLEPIE